jgi:hypothetical protein
MRQFKINLTLSLKQSFKKEGVFMFSDKEIDYLKSQKLARIATVSKGLQPDVAPVG